MLYSTNITQVFCSFWLTEAILRGVCKSLHDVINDTIWYDGKKITRISNWKRKTQTRKQKKKTKKILPVNRFIRSSSIVLAR